MYSIGPTGRREDNITIQAEGRDKDKTFTIREMPAMQAEELAYRALMLLARSGSDVPEDIFSRGAMGFVTLGLGTCLTGLSKAAWHEVKPLLDELMACVVAYQAPNGMAVTIASQVLAQIEEAATSMRLKEAIVSLHLGFSIAAKLSEYRTLIAAKLLETGRVTETSQSQ